MPNVVFTGRGKRVNVRRYVGHLFVCASGCCCGQPEAGAPPVPADVYHKEWERRRLRNHLHLTIGGCLGPCALANVAMLLIGGRTLWFHSMNTPELVRDLYDHTERLLDGVEAPLPPTLAPLQFTASTWQDRPDGLPVYDGHLARPRAAASRQPVDPDSHACATAEEERGPDRLVAEMTGPAAAPRKNGELLFTAPWEGRAFGMAVAMHERGAYAWDAFRDRLIGQIIAAESGDEASSYYERWLAAFESLLIERGVLSGAELDTRTDELEWGVRDEVF